MKIKRPGIITLLFMFVLMLKLFSEQEVSAASKFTYKDYQQKKTVTYSGVQPQYEINGVKLDMSSTPGILNSANVAMAPANTVFRDGVGAKCTYSSSKGRIVISFGDNVLTMYMNSTNADLNGKSVKSSAAPFRVKYSSSGQFQTFVPTRFVAEQLGFTYSWDSSTSTVSITAPVCLLVDNSPFYYKGEFGTLKVVGKSADVTKCPVVMLYGTSLVPLEKAMALDSDAKFTYDAAAGFAVIEKGDITAKLIVGTNEIYVNGILKHAPYKTCIIENKKYGTTELYAPGQFLFKALGYKYSCGSTNNVTISSKTSTGVYSPSGEAVYLVNLEKTAVYKDEDGVKHPYYHEFSLPVPEGSSDITVKDDYYNSTVIVSIPGDHRKFYGSEEVQKKLKDANGNGISQLHIEYFEKTDNTPQHTEVSIVTRTDTTMRILAFKYEKKADSLEFVIDEPKNLFGKVIVLDAGHGGSDPGAISEKVREKVLNYNIVNVYCRELFDNSDIKVYYSRPDDILIELGTRALLGGRLRADMFISVHQNMFDQASVNGTMTFHAETRDQVSPTGLKSSELSEIMIGHVVEQIGFKNGGSKATNFTVTYYNDIPATLIECGFLSNPSNREKLATEEYQRKIAKAIYNAVNEVYEKYGY